MNPGLMHPQLEQFCLIHKAIIDRLDALSSSDECLPDFFACCRQKVAPLLEFEEQKLFSIIFKKAEIRAGGPLCMLYYDLHLNMPSLDRSAAICDLPRLSPQKIEQLPHRRPFYEASSPVCIPIEDHIACNQILGEVESMISLPSHAVSKRALSNMATVYLSILKSNFEKKDNCLLPMAQQLLSKEELSAIPSVKNLY